MAFFCNRVITTCHCRILTLFSLALSRLDSLWLSNADLFQTATILITLSRILVNVMGKHTLLNKLFNCTYLMCMNPPWYIKTCICPTWLSYSDTSKHYFTGYTILCHDQPSAYSAEQSSFKPQVCKASLKHSWQFRLQSRDPKITQMEWHMVHAPSTSGS